ncbi:hypothetical protein C0995_000621 [Termitomyces sp. Mi166|nr:hypothetical protein C0995_000621 [Termitomyces sp. Mi166\
MLTSEVTTRKTVDLDFEDKSASMVHVMVHDIKPPFVDGKTVFMKQLNSIDQIHDLLSDIIVFSKKGSALVKNQCEWAEHAKAAAKLAALGGTASENIMAKPMQTNVLNELVIQGVGMYFSYPLSINIMFEPSKLPLDVAIFNSACIAEDVLTKYLYNFQTDKHMSFTNLIKLILKKLKESFAFISKSKHFPNKVVTAHCGSPLPIGVKMDKLKVDFVDVEFAGQDSNDTKIDIQSNSLIALFAPSSANLKVLCTQSCTFMSEDGLS